ncbi:unnamed protein product [Adineta steineri]|uniref:Uncharacterized protein n=1 Tax=Adineta steineri TaxID=433720 RepID=A0A818PZW4_9BILA|nr:unnamed protein product [Adineta steineri]CAF3627243.1 unnamed protein product [Adineta steineri]
MDEEDLRPAQIRPLAGTTRHRLCAGQVCVSVASCVKELIENSLDAHSTRLQLTFIAHGADLIELTDNGDGIAEHDFEKLGLRYHTSKLSQFEDLENVNTYGFRGEALSSICIYADVTILTRHVSASIGTKLIFDGEGQVISRTPFPREIGTTVSIRSLFNRFPVRRTELQSHSKREFSQALNIIQSFAIISRQIQFFQVSSSADNHPPSHPLLTLTPSSSLKDTLAQIFGQKILESIIHIDDINDDEDKEFKFDGYISRPQHGCGRSSADRQYLYVNNRPIDCAPFLRTINDIYRHFNPNQYPLVALSIEVLDRSTLDINCTPDKRTVFVEHLSNMCDQIRLILNKLFESSSNVYVSSNKRQQETIETNNDIPTPPTKQMKIERFVKKTSHDIPVLTTSNPLSKFSCPFTTIRSEKSTPSLSPSLSTQDRALFTFESHDIVKHNNHSDTKNDECSVDDDDDVNDEDDDPHDKTLLHGSPSKKDFLDKIKQLKQNDEESEEIRVSVDHDLQMYTSTPIAKEKPKPVEELKSIQVTSYKSCEIKVKFNMNKLKEKYRVMSEKTDISSSISNHHFNIHIGEDQNEEAEDELRRQINKTDFERMSIIGQFNRGFILVTLVDHSSQLFIVDQHAADEIYNFHRLYDQTIVSRQPLLHPKTIPLDPSRQVLLQQHIDLFTRLGFDIEIDENESRIDRRCRVHAYPTISGAHSCVFGIDEIDEILSHLTDTSQHSRQEEHYESSRLRKVFASKACRMSIMIGTDLTKKQMINVVRHLAQLAKPWNCPHGRPTIRHVSNLTEATNGFLIDDYHSF